MMNEQLLQSTEEVEQVVYSYLPAEEGHQKTIFEAMNYSVKAGGKRLRPLLMREVYRLFGGTGKEIEPFMAAIEMIHTYSLIHDDLPCMDNDDLRRGKPTNHVVYGAGLATLAGDGLLTFAFELMARQTGLDADKLRQCIAVFARAAGPAGMVGGQAFDLESEGNKSIGLDGLKLLHRMKTGVIFEAAIDLAAILGDATEKQRRIFDTYALQMGLTFQITDDILDFTGDEQTLGKPVGSDARNNKATYVTIFSLPEARRMAEQAAAEAVKAVQPLGDDAWFLRDLVTYMLTRVS